MATTMSSVEHMHVSDEKLKASHLDEAGSGKSALSDDEEYTFHEQGKIIHRVDRRLVLTCGVMYCVSLMDRTNLGQAAIAGMTKELKLNLGFRYVRVDANLKSSMLIWSPEHDRTRIFRHLCSFPASCYCPLPEDRSPTIFVLYHTCLGRDYGKLPVTKLLMAC